MDELFQTEGNVATPGVSKAPRFRSVAYPSNTISHCESLTERINKAFGNLTYSTRERLSKSLNISESHLQTQLSSCVQYGLLELKPKEGYKPTPLFTKLYKPLPSENKADALKECFYNPELYRNIFEACKDSSLTQEGLEIILYRKFKVSEVAAPLAAKIFLENANELGLLDDNGRLNLDGVITEIEEFEPETNHAGGAQVQAKIEEKVTYLPPPEKKTAYKEPEESEIPPIPFFLDGDNRIAKLYMPKGFTKEDLVRVWKVLKGYVE